MTKEIQLTKDKVALVDDDDLERVSAYKWCANEVYPGYWYATSKAGRLHRFIMNAPKGFHVDHRNGDGLDCRKENMRICTHSQNGKNRKIDRDNTTGYKGITYVSKPSGRKKKWKACIRVNGKLIGLGMYLTAQEAALVYDEAARLYHGEFANLNFPVV